MASEAPELRVRVRVRARVRARFRVRVRVISPSPSPNPINPNPYQHDDNVSHAEKSGRVTPTVSAEEAAMEAVGDRPAAAFTTFQRPPRQRLTLGRTLRA